MKLIDAFLAVLAREAAPQKPARPKQIADRRANGALPRGFIDPRQREGTRRIALTLDQLTFDRVRDHAGARNISFAAAARELIERATAPSKTKGVCHE